MKRIFILNTRRQVISNKVKSPLLKSYTLPPSPYGTIPSNAQPMIEAILETVLKAKNSQKENTENLIEEKEVEDYFN